MSQFNTILGRSLNAQNSFLANGQTPTDPGLFWLASQSGSINTTFPHAMSEWYGYDVISIVGNLVMAGDFLTYSGSSNNDIVRINTDGTKDTSFNIGTGTSGVIYSIIQQSDGKIAAAGTFTLYSGSSNNNIVRINTDGTKDTSFNIGTGFNGTVYSIIQQSDGKIVAGGSFTTYSGIPSSNIVRINTDGTRDTGFNIGIGTNGTVRSIIQQSDGKLVVVGQFSNYSGSSNTAIVRINTDGTKDTSFNIGTGFGGQTFSITQQSDSKLIVGGAFSSYSGSTSNYIVRINTDGTKDTSFNVGVGAGFNNTVYSIIQQSNGKIVAGGAFTTYSGSSNNYIVRINTDGTKDTSFNIGTGFNANVLSIIQQSDGKIIAGANFNTYSGSINSGSVRINTDGTKDTSFNIGTGFSNTIYSIVQLK
jgi:uncharacterized delta-60 repeat protein